MTDKEKISRRGILMFGATAAVSGATGFMVGGSLNQVELEEARRRLADPNLLLEEVRREGRQHVFGLVKAFEETHLGQPVTEELLEAYAKGPLEGLFQATFGHVMGINNDLAISLLPRQEFNQLLTTGLCVHDGDPNASNGTMRFNEDGVAEIRVPDVLSIQDALSLELIPVAPLALSEYRMILMHERLHAATVSSYRYPISVPVDGEEVVRQLGLWGLRMLIFTPGDECPRMEWAYLDETAINLLAGEMNGDDERTTESLLLQIIGSVGVSRMEALRFFLERIVGMSPMKFAELYFSSNPKQVANILDRMFNARFEYEEEEKAPPPRRLTTEAFSRIDRGDIDGFHELWTG